jgi:hypothetical protein
MSGLENTSVALFCLKQQWAHLEQKSHCVTALCSKNTFPKPQRVKEMVDF